MSVSRSDDGSPAEELGACVRFLRALASAERLRLLLALVDGARNVGELCQASNIPAANMNHHLQNLVAAGLVRRVQRGRFTFYSLSPGVHEPPPDGSGAGSFTQGRCRLIFPSVPEMQKE